MRLLNANLSNFAVVILSSIGNYCKGKLEIREKVKNGLLYYMGGIFYNATNQNEYF